MKKEELSKWFLNKFNSCYSETCDYQIYWFYNERYIRMNKLCKLNNTKSIIPSKNDHNSICLFHQDTVNKYLWCDYWIIWSFLEKNYSNDEDDVVTIIQEILKDNTELKKYIPYPDY